MRRGSLVNSCLLSVASALFLGGGLLRPSEIARVENFSLRATSRQIANPFLGAPLASGIQPFSAGIVSGLLLAQSAAAPQNKLAPRPAASGLSDFAWLAGKWQGVWGPRVAEQIWTAPKAGQMLGLSRVIENDKTLVIELFSLFQTPGGVELRLRHFTPTLVPWEQSGITTMRLISFDGKLGTKIAVFENAGDGQPKREVFTCVDPDTYVSKSEIGPDAGADHVTEIQYHRQK